MNAPPFTPGPWFVSGKQTIRQDRRADMPVGSCQPIAVMSWRDGPENARLIAAAPDLFNALSVLADAAEASAIPVDAARAALAKAGQP